MNAPHWHLVVNHAPIFAAYFALMFLVLSRLGKDQGLYVAALVLLILGGITAFVADETGGAASHAIRYLPGIVRAQIHTHAEAADYAKLWAFASGLASIAALYMLFKKELNPMWMRVVLLVLTLGTVASMTMTGYWGGLIRHPEISSTFVSPDSAGHAAPTGGK